MRFLKQHTRRMRDRGCAEQRNELNEHCYWITTVGGPGLCSARPVE